MKLPAIFIIIIILVLLIGTMAMPPKSKKKSQSSKRKQYKNHSDQSPTIDENEDYQNKDAFRQMVSDNPLLATYNPDYIDDEVMQKRVLDGYLYTHEYLISSLNYLKPQIKDRIEFYQSFLTRWLILQQYETSDTEMELAMQHVTAANVLQQSLNTPSLLMYMSFFDNALEALLDRRLSKAHIYNVMVNLVSALGSSLSTMESALDALRGVIEQLVRNMESMPAFKRQYPLFKQLEALRKISVMQLSALEKLIQILRKIKLFNVDSVRQSIRMTVATLRGQGDTNPEFSNVVLLSGESHISFLQLYQILFPIVAENRNFLNQLGMVYEKARKLSFKKTSYTQISEYLDSEGFQRLIDNMLTKSPDQHLTAFDRMTAQFYEESGYSVQMQLMLDISDKRFTTQVSIASVVLQGHSIFQKFCLQAMPMIEQLVQKYRLRESDIPHDFAPLQLGQSPHCSFVSNHRESVLCQSEDGTLSNRMSELDLLHTADSSDVQLEGLPAESDVVLDPQYKDEVDFDLDTDNKDDEIQSQDDFQVNLPDASSQYSRNSEEVVPFRNSRKEICADRQYYDRYQYVRSGQLISLQRVVFSADLIFTLCQITDGSTKGGYNVKYKEFLQLLAEFDADVTPLTGSISRITIPMRGTHPLSIHGPHSGNVELGRGVIKGARRVLDYYQILPENFKPINE
ncbi:hypothetical protein MP228_010592 [Amoeboaphelidium protococcarum]|nr:hypothetical protein MP228_010592 [Amoeboaphelidium protococcarum]